MEHGQIDQRTTAVPRAEQRSASPQELESAVAALTLEQKVALLTGVDNFTMPGEPEIGLRGLVFSDGPAGVRGPVLDPQDRSSGLPAPIALAALWDPELVEKVGVELGVEAKAKGVDALLAPTLNLARSPYGGRGFESYGEDPVLAASTGAAFVRGVQSAGVAMVAKHFVGNDAEVDRWTVDVQMNETTLREVYLVPFEAAVTEADCAAVMAGYNLVNGTTMTEHDHLLGEVLKKEWGFAGAVVSDWFAARSTEATAKAGLDICMPGPDSPWGDALVAAVERGDVREQEVDDKVLRLLRVGALTGAFRGPEPVTKPGPHASRAVLRKAAANAFTLLRNIGPLLPLGSPGGRGALSGAGARPGSVALIGPNVLEPQYMGRGSAEVGMALGVSPVDGLRTAISAALASGRGPSEDSSPESLLRVAQGCRTWTSTPLPTPAALREPESGGPGVRLEVYGTDGELRYTGVRPTSEATWWDPDPLVTGPGIGRIVLRSTFTAAGSGRYRVAVGGIGGLELEVKASGASGTDSGEAFTLSGIAPHPADSMVSHAGPHEFGREIELQDGEILEFTAACVPDGYQHDLIRFKVGIATVASDEALLAEAVAAARESEVAIVVVGSTGTTESEGYDRTTLVLPGRQDELIAAVAAANPRTVVVVNSGMPVLMPWADQVGAIIQAWFPGQEFGHALADVLWGEREPGGRLPVTMPRTEADLPIGKAVPVDGALAYREGLLVGYRGYDKALIEPRFPFGHGLGYTDWSYEQLEVPHGPTRAGADVEITVAVTNIGRRAGSLVVQAYLSGPAGEAVPERPVRVLAGFTRAHAGPGETEIVRIHLPSRAFARWDETAGGWTHPRGSFRIEVGSSSRDLRMRSDIKIG